MSAPSRHALAQKPRHPRVTVVVDASLAVMAIVLTPAVEWFDDHVAVPFAKWRADRTGWEKAAAAIRASILLGVLVGAIVALSGCDDRVEVPGHGTEPSAVRIEGVSLNTCEMAEVLEVDPEALAAALGRTS